MKDAAAFGNHKPPGSSGQAMLDQNNGTRISTIQLCCEQVSDHTQRTQYKAGYGFYTVTSRFAGDKSLCDLLYEIIMKKQQNVFDSGQCDPLKNGVIML